ncbi:radical SAM family heme chaperone HemW [Hydrogenimonas urashimensis]|uniref:radical SAM family heme chaperone HemW n=1 Tax=Hydrogenimonas urashimensis TaxID=2740515 RepID=UPI0019156446|nr:radical SAM family heme chaperone HemW [Hydrogenimonas urashimensis]
MKESLLLYLHIPFCDSKCHYCSFNSYVDRFEYKERYMQALLRQLEYDLERFGIQPDGIGTLFIGGGTPSTVSPALYEPLLKLLAPYLQENAEMTTEANPNSATAEWLGGMHELGMNRVSFGVQSFFEEKLRLLGRAHRARDAYEAVENAGKVGFAHVSIDLIYATMLDTPERVGEEIEEALSLPIDHLSAYELTIEEGTPFQKRPEVRQESVEQAVLLRDRLLSEGWEHYEISNFGLSPCRHNLGYWEYRPYLGIGSGAVGRIGHERLYPHREIERYIGDPLHKTVEKLTPEEIVEEKIFLGLRSVVGIETHLLDPSMRSRCDLLAREGKLRHEGRRYYNTDYLLSDEIALFILG